MQCQWRDAAECLKIFKAIQHTNPMVNISFNPAGIYIMSMDRSKTSLVKLCLHPSYMETYSCSQQQNIGIYTETLCNILQKIKKHQLLWKTSDNTLTIICKHDQQKTEFSLRAIDIEEDELDIPDLNDDVAVEINAKHFKDITDKLLMGKTDVNVQINNDTFSLTSDSVELGTIKHSEPLNDAISVNKFNENVDIALSYNSMFSLFMFSTCGTGQCFLGFSNQMPSRLRVMLNPDSYICLYVAPKIVDDE